MTTQKCVTYQSTCKLGCSVFPTAAVICVPSYFLNRLVCPESEEPGTYEYTTLEGVIVAEQVIGAGCGGVSSYKYTFCYDEALTVLGLTITGSDITGIFTEECWGQWVKDLVGNESFIRTEEDDSQTFISEHGCEYPLVSGGEALCVTPTDSIAFEIDEEGCVTGDVNLSATIGNQLTANPDGLYDANTNSPVRTEGASYVVLITDGTILAVPSGAPQTITLPAAGSDTGHKYYVKKITSNADQVIVTTAGGSIDGSGSDVIATYNESRCYQDDGANYRIL